MVYDVYIDRGYNIYIVLFTKHNDCYDMRDFEFRTENLPDELCCQHLDEDRSRIFLIIYYIFFIFKL